MNECLFAHARRENTMIENNPTNVQAAFEMLLEEIEAEIDFVNGVGSKAFEKRDYERAKEALEHAGKLTGFRDKAVALKKEWDGFAVIEVDEEDRKTAQKQRQNLGRLKRGCARARRRTMCRSFRCLPTWAAPGRWPRCWIGLGRRCRAY